MAIEMQSHNTILRQKYTVALLKRLQGMSPKAAKWYPPLRFLIKNCHICITSVQYPYNGVLSGIAGTMKILTFATCSYMACRVLLIVNIDSTANTVAGTGKYSVMVNVKKIMAFVICWFLVFLQVPYFCLLYWKLFLLGSSISPLSPECSSIYVFSGGNTSSIWIELPWPSPAYSMCTVSHIYFLNHPPG